MGTVAPHYQTYLDGEHWANIKAKYSASKLPKRCRVCGTTERLVLHHRTYKHLYKEHIGIHLHLVCWSCHNRIHFDESGYKTPLTWKALTMRETWLRKSFKKHKKFIPHPETTKRLNLINSTFNKTINMKPIQAQSSRQSI